ncbi:hypothetical protein [Sphingosinicella humi]|uniref:Uncharacterized protein n=1 Tax=Allosphingosinicella humi TaxID=2068657 RepID=A0A2U2J4M7_9SPHN|nr:hypothetical protein [Sphingosinicella humi]PWG03303.1 hypothetical protein DF286_10815 [Sphingosinicella humi]
MDHIIRMPDAEAVKQAAFTGGEVQISVSVPIGSFAKAAKHMNDLLEVSPVYYYHKDEWPLEDIQGLCAVFWTLMNRLPLTPSEHLQLLERFDNGVSGGQYVREFIAGWVQTNPEDFLGELSDATIDELAGRASKVKRRRRKAA